MINRLIIRLVAGFGLAFILIHTVYIYHIVNPVKLSMLYLAFWRIFLITIAFSIVFLVHTLVIHYFNKKTKVATCFLPLIINTVVLVSVYLISLFRG